MERGGHRHVPLSRYTRTVNTSAVYYGYIVTAMTVYMIGPAMVSFGIMFEATTGQMAGSFTGLAGGYLVGAIICGHIYDRLNNRTVFMVGMFLASGASLALSFARDLVMFICSTTVLGCFLGTVDTASNTCIVTIWAGHRLQPAFVQGLYCFYSIGSTIGPFMMHPFLVDLPPTQLNNTRDPNGSVTELYIAGNQTTGSFKSSELDVRGNKVSSVRTGFIVAAGVIISSSLLHLIIFLRNEPSCLAQQIKTKTTSLHRAQRTVHNKSELIILIFVALFYSFYQILEAVPGFFLATYVVKGLGWENGQGSFITSTYFGGIAVGRVLGIPTSVHVNSKRMIIGDLVLANMGFIMMLFSSKHYSIIWIACALTGLGLATLQASVIMVAEAKVKIDGRAASVVIGSSSAGVLVSPLITGFLMDRFSYGCMVYVCMVCSSIVVGVCTGLILLTSGPRRESHEYIQTEPVDDQNDVHEATEI